MEGNHVKGKDMKGTDMKLETGDAYIDPGVQGGDEGRKRRVKTPT